MNEEALARLVACEQKNRRVERWIALQFFVPATTLLVGSCVTHAALPQSATSRLRVNELVVVDPQGVERVRISGDLPDAVIEGKRVPRGEKAAGVILYDQTGQERGGYVTWEPSGNVGLTLDTRKEQVTLFMAGPQSGSVLLLRHSNDLIELRSDDDGSRLTLVKGGRVVFQQPSITMSDEACSAYREARSRLANEEVRVECVRRFTESDCQACLGE